MKNKKDFDDYSSLQKPMSKTKLSGKFERDFRQYCKARFLWSSFKESEKEKSATL